MTKAELATLLETKVRDAGNATWTDAEISNMIDEALREIPNIVEDSTLAALSTTQDYTVPSTIDVVKEVWITQTGGTIKEYVDPGSWDQAGTTLRFDSYPPYTGTFTLIGTKLMTSTDTIPEKAVNFVLYTAVYKLWEMLATKFGTGFLKNDLTMAEIQLNIDVNMKRAEKYRNQMGNFGYKL